MVEVDKSVVAANQPIQVQIAGVEIAWVEIVEVDIVEVEIVGMETVKEQFEVVNWNGNFAVAQTEEFGLVENIARTFALEFVAARSVSE